GGADAGGGGKGRSGLASASSISERFMITGTPSRKFSPTVRASLYVRGWSVVIRDSSWTTDGPAAGAWVRRRCEMSATGAGCDFAGTEERRDAAGSASYPCSSYS